MRQVNLVEKEEIIKYYRDKCREDVGTALATARLYDFIPTEDESFVEVCTYNQDLFNPCTFDREATKIVREFMRLHGVDTMVVV